jgi:hypothetical protein
LRQVAFLLTALLVCARVAAAQESTSEPGRPLVAFSIGPEVGARQVSYRDRLTPALAGFQGGVMALLGANLELYPAARSRVPFLADLGLVGSISRSLTERVVTADDAVTLHDTWTTWDAGLRWRAVLDGWDWFGISARYGSLIDTITPGLTGDLIPTGAVSYVRPGVDGHFPAGPVSPFLSAGYLVVTSDTMFAHDFAHSQQGGIDLSAGITLPLASWVALRASGKYMRFFYSFHPTPGDAYVAGGALDEYWIVDLSVLLHT